MKIPFVDLKPQYQALKSDIQKAIEQVLEHGQFILGPEVQQLEADLEEFTGARALAVGSGTDALMMALMAYDLKPGDEVITTSFSFFATAEMIAILGLTPVFVDIDPKTYNMDPNKVEEAITTRTKAILPVSLYGQIPDMKSLKEIAVRHNLPIIEDAAQSFGATYSGQKSCALTEMGCTSFFPAKPLGTYGDGGAVFTNNPELYDRLAQIRNHGQTTRYNHVRIGFNGRLDTLQCAILKVKLARYDWEIKKRQEVAAAYNEGLKETPNVMLPYVAEGCDSVWAQYTIRVKDRGQLQAALSEKGVPTAVHYPKPMHLQPVFKGIEIRHDLTESEKAADEVLSLPLYADMPSEHISYVVNTLKECL